ncbi:hypothetical protein Tco_0778958 [Tanacetum coccineum]
MTQIVDEGPNAAAAFMANLSSTSATNSQVNEEMHQEEHLDSDAETEIDDNTIPYHQYLLDTEAQNVPTEVSADASDKVSMIAILTDLQTQKLDGTMLEGQEQALVIQRNKRNAELVQENDLLKSTLSGKEKSIEFLQSEKEKTLSEKKDLADSYLDEIVCLKNANKVARDMTSNRPTQKPPVQQNKKPNVPVNLSTRTKPATESRKPMPKCHTSYHRICPIKCECEEASDHNRKLNVVYHNQFVIRSLKSVNTKTPHAKHSVNHTKKVWKATRNHNVNTTKTAWRPTGKIVGSVKPQWKPHWSKGRTVADSIAERLTRPTAYKFKTDCNSFLSGSTIWRSGCIAVCQRKLLVKQGKPTTPATLSFIKSTSLVMFCQSVNRIQLDGLKVENVSLKRRYDELSKANTHSRTAYTEKINALTAEIAKLKTELSGKKSGGSTASEKPKVLASGMYTKSSKYIPPPKRANWVKPTPLPKKKQVTFQEPPRTSNRPTQKPRSANKTKKLMVPVKFWSTRTKHAT